MRTFTFFKFLLLSLLFGGTALRTEAQVAKFGKISQEELAMRFYEQDTTAEAVILSDYGKSYFIYAEGFKVVFERQTRIKILKKSGYNWANVSVPVYSKGSKGEKLTSLKGFTYNLTNGKVEKDKLESKDMFNEQISEYWTAKKFTMPNVKEGSIIEFSYMITSDYIYNLRDWEFQSSIPVAWSEYNVKIPEYFGYKKSQQGYLPFHSVTNRTERAPLDVRQSGGKSGEEISFENISWTMKDAPAMREEKFITTIKDYVSKIEFELEVYKPPHQIQKVMTGNWAEVTEELDKETNFGVQLNRNGYFKDEVGAINAKYTTPLEKVSAIYELVKSTMTWNQKYGIYTSGPLRKAYDRRTGSVAEINLMLVAMLREAGLTASPVILSTRDHGRIFTAYSPMLNKFNYVVAQVSVGDKEYLVDATDPLLPIGMLPVRCLNGEGRIINIHDQRWINLNPSQSYTKLINTEIKVNGNGEMIGKGVESLAGYNALYLRKSIKENGEEKFAEQRAKEIGNLKMGKPEFININETNSAVSIMYDISSAGNGQSNDIIYLNPLLGQGNGENPFKLTERAYPVDFAAPIDETYITKFIIPAGYVVDEMPKNVAVNLPENSGRFTYMLQKEGNEIQVMSRVNINKPVFYAQEYLYLKEFYDHIVAKHAEQIVLKKAASN